MITTNSSICFSLFIVTEYAGQAISKVSSQKPSLRFKTEQERTGVHFSSFRRKIKLKFSFMSTERHVNQVNAVQKESSSTVILVVHEIFYGRFTGTNICIHMYIANSYL